MSSQRVDLLHLPVTKIDISESSTYPVSTQMSASLISHRVVWATDPIRHFTCKMTCRRTARGDERRLVQELWDSVQGGWDSFWIADEEGQWVNVRFDQDELKFTKTLKGWFETDLQLVSVKS